MDYEHRRRGGEHEAQDGGTIAPGKAAPTDRLVQRRGQGQDAAPADVHATAAAGVAGAAERLPFLDVISASFGHHDVAQIGAHTDGAAAAAAQHIGAAAYATGDQVAFGAPPDLHTAAHEAAHVVQQRAGVQLYGGVGAAGDAYEHHADQVADRVVRGESAAALLDGVTGGGGRGGGASPAVQKDELPPTPTKTELLDAATLLGGTLTALDDHTRKQVDWHKDPSIAGAAHTNLRTLIELARTGSILTACGDMKVQELIDTKLSATVKANLKAYSDAVAKVVPTVELEPIADVAKALKQGEALIKLNKAAGGVTMRHIMKGEQLDAFIDDGEVDPFVAYVKTSKPGLGAAADPGNKDEITSFVKLHAGGDPNRFHGSVKHVRNYHHFENDALDQLAQNEPKTNDPKKSGLPFNLILHSGLDHNGAFHQDPNITAVVKTGFTILVEGAHSIGDIQGQLKPLAKRYGGGKISQAMIAGHGGPTGMQLAGDVAVQEDKSDPLKSKLVENDDSLEIGGDPADPAVAKKQAETDAFFDELLANMANDPKDPGRIVLNACLTNALPNGEALPADAALAKKKILENPSLTKHLQDLADGKKADDGSALKIDVKGSNASFGEVGLLDPANPAKLDIVDKRADADLLTSPKLEYVEKGIEPEGAIRAVLQVWAEDQAGCIAAVKKRIAASKGKGWAETLIRTMYEQVAAAPDNAEQINHLAGIMGSGFGECNLEAECRVEKLWGVDADFANHYFPKLATTTDWLGSKHLPIVMAEKWLEFDAGKRGAFLAALDTFATCGPALTYIDGGFLQTTSLASMKTLLGPATPAPPTGAVKLAFIMLDAYNDLDAFDFVKALVDANGGTLTPYKDFLKGMTTEPAMIEAVTPKGKEVADPDADKPKPKKGNADLDEDQSNETRLEPFVRDGQAAVALHVRKGPGTAFDVFKTIYPGDPVAIIGTSGEWYAIEHDGKAAHTAFVHAKYVTLT